jgi:hypothetical protein
LVILGVWGGDNIHWEWVGQEIRVSPAGDKGIVFSSLLASLFPSFVSSTGEGIPRLVDERVFEAKAGGVAGLDDIAFVEATT